MQYLCSGFGANVTICSACAADLCEVGGGGVRMSAYAVPVQRICAKSAAGAAPRGGMVKHAFSSKVSVLPDGSIGRSKTRLVGLP